MVEKSLTLKVNEYKSLMKALPVEVAMFDRNICYLAMSESWQKSYGVDDSILGKSHYEVFQNIPERWKKIHREVLESGKPQHSEQDHFYDNEGHEHYLAWNVSPWFDHEGGVGGLIFFTKNLTEQEVNKKRTEEAQNIARLGWWDFNILTGVISWSPIMFDLFPEDIDKGAPDFERHRSTIHPDDVGMWESTVKEAMETGCSYHFIFRVVHPDKVVSVEATGQPRKNEDGKIVGLYGTCMDVTERERNHRRLKVLNEELASFSYRASHDLKAPLTSVQGLIELCKDDLEEGSKKDVLESLHNMDKLIEELKGTIDEVLTISKINFGEEATSLVTGNEIKETLKNKFGPLFDKHSIQFEMTFFEGDVHLKKRGLLNIIENLVSNSVKYHHEKRSSFIRLSLTKEANNTLRIEVIDNGIGIPSEFHDRVFKMFEQFHTQSEGTGLGLYMIKKEVEKLNGRLNFSSSSEGTTFEILMPYYES